MTNPAKALNAWVDFNEDEPKGTVYTSSDSCFQTLIRYGVYNAVNMLGICFFKTTGPNNNLTLEIGSHTHNPGGYSNDQYLQWVTRDARASNPDIKFLATLDYGTNWFAPLFNAPKSAWQSNVNAFAANLLSYLQANYLDGFDIDWEGTIASGVSQPQFAMLFQAIRAAFKTSTGKYFYLTIVPVTTQNLDAPTVNQCFDFVTLQLYGGADPQWFIQYGIDKSLLAYGAKFESNGSFDPSPYQNAQQAYQDYQSGGYGVAMQWRLNSGDYQFEQAQQIMLNQMIWPPAGNSFDDSPIVGAAGNPPITQLVVRSGNVLDAIQATNTGSFSNQPLTYSLPQHGGNGGSAATVTIVANDPITQVSGYTGTWFGWNAVLQITLTARSGKTFGPYGSMANATSKTPFKIMAPQGQSIVAFKGTTVVVPEASGPSSAVIASLGCTVA